MKIEAAVRNARSLLKVQEEFGDFDSYCWRFVGGKPKLNRWKTIGQIPATSPESRHSARISNTAAFASSGRRSCMPTCKRPEYFVECFRYREIMREVANAN
jgi:DNA-3-methyladenine glycosylase I